MDNAIGGEDVFFNYGGFSLAGSHSKPDRTAAHLSIFVLAFATF